MMLEPKALSGLKSESDFSVKGYSPWQAGTGSADNKNFIEAFTTKYNRKPGLFSLLGWETGMILKEIASGNDGSFGDGAGITASLQKIKFKSPRGEMILDPQTNYFLAPFVQCSMDPGQEEISIKQQDLAADAWAAYILQPTDGSGSGWTNTYLCY
jgi:hypothetical protein